MMKDGKMKFQDNSGFTLLELMIVTVVLAIGAAVSVWSARLILPEMRLKQAIRNLKSDMQLTRLRAIREDTGITMLFDTVNNKYTVFYDNGGTTGTPDDWKVNGDEQVVKTGDMPRQVTLNDADFPDGSDQARVRFNRLGIPSNPGTVQMTDTRSNTRSLICNAVAQMQIQ
jgi:prepilin-type N-terminal cleavage/methylation domain-containing protein